MRETLPNYKELKVVRGMHEIWLRMDTLIDCALGIQVCIFLFYFFVVGIEMFV